MPGFNFAVPAKSGDANGNGKFSFGKRDGDNQNGLGSTFGQGQRGDKGQGSQIDGVFSFHPNKDDKSSTVATKELDEDELMKGIVIPSKYDKLEEPLDEGFQIDDKTLLPITKLPYPEGPIESGNPEWLKNGRHLDLSVDKAGNSGVLYLSAKREGEVDEKAIVGASNTKIYPFELDPTTDRSSERVEFLNRLYEDFEPLLKNKTYKTYSEEDDDMNIGVLSIIEKHKEEKKTFLRSLTTNTIENLKDLISLKMKEMAGNEDDEANFTNIFNYEEVLNVLNLLNALKFAREDERIILLQMWVNRASLQPEESTVAEAMDNEDGKPYRNIIFWSGYMKKLILRGYFDQALSALDESGYGELEGTDKNLFDLITDFGTLMANYDAVTFSHDLKAFIEWKKGVVNVRDRAQTLHYKNIEISVELQEIISLMSGLEKTVEASCSSWYEFVLARFMYGMPSMKLMDGYVEAAEAAFPINSVYSWETICLDLFRSKYLKVITSLEVVDRSIATYIAVLLSADGLLAQYSELMKEEGEDIGTTIDKMLGDLALAYLTDQELFPIGVGILVTSGDSKSREILSQMLPTFQIENNDDFEWCLSVCAKLKLPQTAIRIYNIQGEALLNRGYEYESLECFAEAGNPTKVVESVWKIFENLLLDGDYEDNLLNERIDRNDIESPILRQALAPLALLREIVLNKDSSKPPFDKLINLLEFKYLPAYYKPVLLLLILPYFNTGTFSLEQLIEIIKILNSYEKQLKKDDEAFENSSEMYSLAIERGKDTKSEDEFDWRNRNELPKNCGELIFEMRKMISFEVSFKFLEEDRAD
ncbi:DEKNAAC104391, partial [Brettanomyces naardenensis]